MVTMDEIMKKVFILLAACLVFSAPALPALAQPGPGPGSESFSLSIPEWQARLELAALLGYEQEYDQAEAEYKKVLQVKPDLPQALLGLSQVYFWKGDTKQAYKTLNQVPKDRIKGEDVLLLADLNAAQGRYVQAEDGYEQYLRDNPDNLKARFRLAQTLSWQKKYPQALAEYETILQKAPQDNQVRRHYAQVLSWAGKSKEAIIQYRKSLEE